MEKAKPLMVKAGTLTESGLVVCPGLYGTGAWFTDMIGLHAVFGAFVTGAAMPRGVVSRDLIGRIQPLTVALLLPLFFTYSGLNTRIGLLNTGFLWMICGAVLVAAILGKGVACWLAARSTGLPNREALGIGVLDERARADGADHHQYRPPAWHYLARAFRHAGDHGRGDDAHGIASLRPAGRQGLPSPFRRSPSR